MAIRIGIVAAVHPEDHSLDVIMTDDYSRLSGVQLLSTNGGSAFGTHDMFVPDEKSGEAKWGIAKRSPEDQKVAIDFSGPMPIAIGFLYPQIGQMTFADKNFRVQRHSSDVYSTINAAGDFELAFPNGTFIRVGASPDHQDLAAKDFDKKWGITKNTGAATHLRLVLGNGGAVKADLHIDPAGNVTGTFQGTGELTFVGDLTINAPNVTVNTQVATVNASTSVELVTPLTHCTGELIVDGKITGAGGMAISGSGFTHNGKNVGDNHRHLNSGGSGTGGTPS